MNPLRIHVIDNGSIRKAIFWETTDTPVERSYRVQFDDGYDTEIFYHYDRLEWCEEKVGFTELAKKAGKAIEVAFEQVLKHALLN